MFALLISMIIYSASLYSFLERQWLIGFSFFHFFLYSQLQKLNPRIVEPELGRKAKKERPEEVERHCKFLAILYRIIIYSFSLF